MRKSILSMMLAVAMVMSLLTGVAFAAGNQIYYVATTGNDANSGTQDAPFATVQKAVNMASDGDTVIIKEGSYNVFCPVSNVNNYTGRSHNLFIGKNITVKGEAGKNVVLYSYQETYTATFDARITVLVSGTDGIVVDNLTILPSYYPESISTDLDTVTGSVVNSLVGKNTLKFYYNQIIDTMRNYNGSGSVSRDYIDNLTIQNCVIGDQAISAELWGSAIYFPGAVGNATNYVGMTGGYTIQNNTLYGSVCICEGASKDVSSADCVITDNTFHGALILNGQRPTGWNYLSLPVFPTVTGNTFKTVGGITDGHEWFIGSRDGNETAVIPTVTLESYLKDNSFSAEGYNAKIVTGSYAYSETATEYYALIVAEESASTVSPTPSAPVVTVPVTGDSNTVHVEAEITEDTATVLPVNPGEIDAALSGNDATGVVTVDLSAVSETVTTVNLPITLIEDVVAAAEHAHNDTEHLAIALPAGTVTLDDVTMRTIIEQAEGEDVQLVLETNEPDQLNDAQAGALAGEDVHGTIEVYFVCNETGRRISDFNGGEAVLKVPFEIPAGKVAKGFSVWYVDDFGRKTKHETWHENGHIHWKTGHFSDYVIIYDAADANGPSFIDAIETPVAPVEPEVPAYIGNTLRFNDVMLYNSAYDAINFVADRGIMNGTGAAQFSPDADLTRAMMATILWRMEGQPTAWYNGQFSDVKGGQWYSSAIAWANAAGIVEGYGNGVFGLNDSLTHGQLCAMLYRWNTRSYGDIDTAWNWAQANGLYADLAGINADEAATRAEIAEVLMAFVLRVW